MSFHRDISTTESVFINGQEVKSGGFEQANLNQLYERREELERERRAAEKAKKLDHFRSLHPNIREKILERQLQAELDRSIEVINGIIEPMTSEQVDIETITGYSSSHLYWKDSKLQTNEPDPRKINGLTYAEMWQVHYDQTADEQLISRVPKRN